MKKLLILLSMLPILGNASENTASKQFSQNFEIQLDSINLSNVPHYSISLCERTVNKCKKLGHKKYYTEQELANLEVEESDDTFKSIVAATFISVPTGFVVGATGGLALAGGGAAAGSLGIAFGGATGAAYFPHKIANWFKPLSPSEQATQSANLKMILLMIDQNQNVIRGKDILKVSDRLELLLNKIDEKID